MTPRAQEIVYDFSKLVAQYGLVRIPGGRFVNAAVKVFGTRTADKDEYRFHRNHLKDFMEHLVRHGVSDAQITLEEKPLVIAPQIEIVLKDLREPREEQPAVIAYLEADTEYRSKFVPLQTGKGKLQPLCSKIKVPGGWSTMGEMSVGTKVIAKDGSTTHVTGVFPQGSVDIYKVTFADGRSTEAGAEHLWRVYYINTQPHSRWRVVNTLEVLRLISMPNPRVYVDLCDSEESPEIELPLDAYFLGLLLGNGYLGGSSIKYTTQDASTIDYIRAQLPSWMRIRYLQRYDWSIASIGRGNQDENIVRTRLKSLGLLGCVSQTKFIPKRYLHASTSQRLSLLQGLLDTDGTVQKSGSVSYCTTSKQLAEDVQYLVRSLGGIAALRPRQTYYTHNGEKKAGLPAFEVDIRYKKASELFRVSRKRDRTNDSNQYADSLKLRVSSIELIGKKEAQCISIDHPDRLYITDDFIVTHNTFCALRAMSTFSKRIVVVVKPMYMMKWARDFSEAYECELKDVMVVKGSAHLQGLIAMAKEGTLESKFIVISNKTMQNWLKLYEVHHKGILDMGYDCLPEDLYEVLGAGIRLIDEVHQDFHLNFKLDLYTHIERTISLSATLVNNDPFLEKMYRVSFPQAERYEGGPLDKYVISRALIYQLHPSTRVRTSEFGSTSYSHNAFERSILKNHLIRDSYFKLIWNTVEIGFMHDYKPGEKCAVFCSSIDMCTEVTKFLAAKYPHLDVRRYVAADPEENLHEPDIRVTTILSGGTAHDISNLKTVIVTIAIDSLQANIQTLGRLRKIPGLNVQFIYFTCSDIPKHMEYHGRKERMLHERAASYKIINAPHLV